MNSASTQSASKPALRWPHDVHVMDPQSLPLDVRILMFSCSPSWSQQFGSYNQESPAKLRVKHTCDTAHVLASTLILHLPLH